VKKAKVMVAFILLTSTILRLKKGSIGIRVISILLVVAGIEASEVLNFMTIRYG
jgi:hypothetical protein